ncbi:MAG: hypothetical protein EBU46_20185 [Nitrosomonadaceae bacterium]|nr:hypothetical protein [Nitrosomonadaceae bacterium]
MPVTTENPSPQIRYRLTVNTGFITNSSSCVHWFDRRVLKDPQVKQFIDKFELADGEVGSDLMNRSSCGSFIPNAKRHAEAIGQVQGSDYAPPIKPEYDDSQVITIYGDEYQTVFSILTGLMREAAERLKVNHQGADYN